MGVDVCVSFFPKILAAVPYVVLDTQGFSNENLPGYLNQEQKWEELLPPRNINCSLYGALVPVVTLHVQSCQLKGLRVLTAAQ